LAGKEKSLLQRKCSKVDSSLKVLRGKVNCICKGGTK